MESIQTPADLTYRHGSDGVTTFMPNTPEGDKVWREFFTQNHGTNYVLSIHAEDVANQLRAAGYTVAEAPKPEARTPQEDDALLEALGYPDPTVPAMADCAELPDHHWFDTFITIAADSVAVLRSIDVYRVLSEAPATDRAALGDYIASGRKDLADEVHNVLSELATERAVP